MEQTKKKAAKFYVYQAWGGKACDRTRTPPTHANSKIGVWSIARHVTH